MIKKLTFDVMLDDKFICTMHMPYCPLFILEDKDICAYIEKKRPSLKGKKYTICF